MSKFTREIRRSPERHGFTSERVAGGFGNLAGREEPRRKLRRMAALFHLGPHDHLYYRQGLDGRHLQLAELIVEFVARGHVAPEDAFEVAQEVAREGARHGPALIAVGLVKAGRADLVRRLDEEHLVGTPRQAFDMLAMWRLYGNREGRYPHAMTDLIACRFPAWDEYQLRKHYGEPPYTVRALLRLTHPQPQDEVQSALWRRIRKEGKAALPVPDTWEVALSAAGSDLAARRHAWERLMAERKLPALATIRNLRNMRDDGVPLRRIERYIAGLRPRYLSVFNVIKAMAVVPELTMALDELMRRFWSGQAERRLPGMTEIVIDVSGSMGRLPRRDGSVYLDNDRLSRAVAVAYALMLAVDDYRVIFTAGDDWARKHASEAVKVPRNIRDLITATVQARDILGGGGIFTTQVLEWAAQQFQDEPDRVVVISDSQDCDYPERARKRPRRGRHMIEVNIAPYKDVHVTDEAYGGVWTVIEGFADPVPYILSVEAAKAQAG